MDMKKHFEKATEKFEFTVNLGGWRGKKVLEFLPTEDNDKYSTSFVKELSMLGKITSVKSITKQGLILLTFDILDNSTTAKIKWEDIELGNTLDTE